MTYNWCREGESKLLNTIGIFSVDGPDNLTMMASLDILINLGDEGFPSMVARISSADDKTIMETDAAIRYCPHCGRSLG